MNRIGFYGICLLFSSLFAQGQNAKKIVQVSGLVVGGDSLYGIPGVTVFVPRTGRGTHSNDLGYFSLASIAGDSIEISAIGFKKHKIITPFLEKQSMTLLIELQEDTVFYPIVEIFPYPTEAIFKKAFLTMGNPNQANYDRMAFNLHPALIQKMLSNSSMSASENQKYSLKNQLYGNTQGFQLLNPFAWSRFLKSVRKPRRNATNDNFQED
jgi:hypothetical protein